MEDDQQPNREASFFRPSTGSSQRSMDDAPNTNLSLNFVNSNPAV